MPVICTIGPSPLMIACITACCIPRNSASDPIIICSWLQISTCCSCLNCRYYTSSYTMSNGLRLRLLCPDAGQSSALSPKNRCHCQLTARNWSCCCTVPDDACYSSRAYIIPAMYIPCPAYRSYMLSSILSLLSSSLPLPPILSCPNDRFKNQFDMAMAIWRHILMFNLVPNNRSLCYCIMHCSWSDIHLHSCIQSPKPSVSASISISASASALASASRTINLFLSHISLPSSCFIISSTYRNALYLSIPFIMPSTCYQNSSTNYRYYTSNSPTSYSRYR